MFLHSHKIIHETFRRLHLPAILYVISKTDLVCVQKVLRLTFREEITKFIGSHGLFQAFLRNMEVQDIKVEEDSSEAVFKQSNTCILRAGIAQSV
jgi:hypothetical protein